MAKVKTKPAKHLRGGLDVTPPPTGKRKARLNAEEQRVNRILDVILSVCSGAWREDIVADAKGEIEYPVPGMVLSRCKVLTTGDMVSNNAGEVGTRRWHPSITDRLEDMLDRMEIKQAGRYVHPPAVRYDHMTPYRESVVYDPRSIRVDDPEAWILRTTKLEAWPAGHAYSGRTSVRCSWPNVYKVKSADGGWLMHKGKPVELIDGRRSARDGCPETVPFDPVVESYIQVTE